MASGRQPILVVIEAPGFARGSRIVLPIGRRIVLGRAAGADIAIPDGTIARRHAVLEVGLDGDVDLNDEGSTNGTYVDDSWVEGKVRLAPGARIAIADVAFFEFAREGSIDPVSIRRCPACERGLEDRSEFAPGLLICAGCRSVIDTVRMRVEMTGASLMRFVEPFVAESSRSVRECIERLAATEGAPLWILKLPEVAPRVRGYRPRVRFSVDAEFEPGSERRLREAHPGAFSIVFASGSEARTLGFAGFEIAVMLPPLATSAALFETIGLARSKRHPANYALAPVALVEPAGDSEVEP